MRTLAVALKGVALLSLQRLYAETHAFPPPTTVGGSSHGIGCRSISPGTAAYKVKVASVEKMPTLAGDEAFPVAPADISTLFTPL